MPLFALQHGIVGKGKYVSFPVYPTRLEIKAYQ
jgi:hypothetical protein